ncbi:MAG TPA: hypothetical protein VFA64_19865 [Hyphomicrobiaceae bacterium]|nr:hypothetical protein [Hyphomicrobiaceae bacterium]
MKLPKRTLATPIVAALCGAGAAAAADLQWEIIENTCPSGMPAYLYDCALTQRLKVPGGWLVRSARITRDPATVVVPPLSGKAGGSYTTGGGTGAGVGLTFLPDAGHTWQP